MTNRIELSLHPDVQARGRRQQTLKASLLVVALLGLGTCNQSSNGSRQSRVPAKNNVPAGPTAKVKFNTGYGTATAPDILGNIGGDPNFLKGHTWVTRKALEYLTQRNLLPAVLRPERYKSYLYYGTAFADEVWMGRPEAPNVPVWNAWVKNLDAVAGLADNISSTPLWNMSCPYTSNCDLDALAYLLADGGPIPCSQDINPERYCINSMAYWPVIQRYSPSGLHNLVGTIGGADCTNFRTKACGEPRTAGQRGGWLLPFDYTYECLRDAGTQQSCLSLSNTVLYHRPDVQPVYEGFFHADLDMNATAVLGVGNAYQRTHELWPFAGNTTPGTMPSPRVHLRSPSGKWDIQLLEENLPLHTNPAVLFRFNVSLGGDDDPYRGLTWETAVVKDFALDNLYHYALSDILQYEPSVLGSWGPPHDPTSTDPGLAACNGIANAIANIPPYQYQRYLPGTVQAYEQCMLALSPYSANILGYPFLAADFANIQTDYPNLKQEALYQLQLQTVYGNTGYGAAKYGAILYQLARKFFRGSPAQPTTTDLVYAGDGVPGWATGRAQGSASTIGGADFTNVSLPFPHTYLGGNPFICDGSYGTNIDQCLTGQPTWPIWVPDTYDAADKEGSLAQLRQTTPSKSNRAALIYLGWASHFMQDLALPHHASNWSGYRHDAQDKLGDIFAMAEAIEKAAFQGQPFPAPVNDGCYDSLTSEDPAVLKSHMDQFDQTMDALLTQMLGQSGPVNWTAENIASFCSANGLARNSIVAGSTNWSAVYGSYLQQGQTAFAARDPGVGSSCTSGDLQSSYAGNIMKNAVLGTVKLILCAAPFSAQQLLAPENVRAVRLQSNGIDVTWSEVQGATGYSIYVAPAGTSNYELLAETTDRRWLARNVLNGTATDLVLIVVAKDANGIEGVASAPVPVLPMAATLGPVILFPTPNDGQVRLDWMPFPGAIQYAIWMTTDLSAGPSTATPPTRTTVDTYSTFTGLTNGTTYYFWVMAGNGDVGPHNSTIISNVVAVAPGIPVLPAPQHIKAVPVDNGVELIWEPVAGATSYGIYRVSASATQYFLVDGTVDRFWTNRNLINGQWYAFVVVARDANGVGGIPSRRAALYPGLSPSLNATAMWARPESGRITLEWLPIERASWYYLSMSPEAGAPPGSGEPTTVSTFDTSYAFEGLSDGVAYYFWLSGGNGDRAQGSDPISEGVRAIPGMTVLSAPQNLRTTPVTASSELGAIDLTWDLLPGATKFVVYQAGQGSSDNHPVRVVSSALANSINLYTPELLPYGSGYSFVVAGLDANNVQGAWATGAATAESSPELTAPATTAATGDSLVVLSWSAVPGASNYYVWMKTEGGADFSDEDVWRSWSVRTAGTSYLFGNLTNGVTYYFWVQASNSQTPWYAAPISSVVSARPQAPCPGVPACSGHGTCADGYCSCEAGYSSPDCSVTCPGGPTCSGHGICSNGVCSCAVEYAGVDCSVTCPGGPTCSGHGTCNAGICTCAVGYTGDSCSINCGPSSSCPNGTACTNNSQCTTRSCVNGVCKALACAPNCTQGTACGSSSDCGSGVCTNRTCQPPSCSPNCGQGSACGLNDDCSSRVCTSSTCRPPSCAPHCNQGAACGAAIDCGSGACASGVCQPPACSPQCATGAQCGLNGDCSSRVCTDNTCVAPSCSPRCTIGAYCGTNGDCLSRVCTAGTCRAPACAPNCPRGTACGSNTDCTSRVCGNGICW
jgi:fibronectin type 3 domain-containing protein